MPGARFRIDADRLLEPLAASERAWPSSKPSGTGADKIIAEKHAHAGIPVPPARSQVEARGKIVDRDRASMRGNTGVGFPRWRKH